MGNTGTEWSAELSTISHASLKRRLGRYLSAELRTMGLYAVFRVADAHLRPASPPGRANKWNAFQRSSEDVLPASSVAVSGSRKCFFERRLPGTARTTMTR